MQARHCRVGVVVASEFSTGVSRRAKSVDGIHKMLGNHPWRGQREQHESDQRDYEAEQDYVPVVLVPIAVGEIQDDRRRQNDGEKGDYIGPVEEYDQGFGAINGPSLPDGLPEKPNLLLKSYDPPGVGQSYTLEVAEDQGAGLHVDEIRAYN